MSNIELGVNDLYQVFIILARLENIIESVNLVFNSVLKLVLIRLSVSSRLGVLSCSFSGILPESSRVFSCDMSFSALSVSLIDFLNSLPISFSIKLRMLSFVFFEPFVSLLFICINSSIPFISFVAVSIKVSEDSLSLFVVFLLLRLCVISLINIFTSHLGSIISTENV